MNITKRLRNSLIINSLLPPPNSGSRLNQHCIFAVLLMLAAGLAGCGRDTYGPDSPEAQTRHAVTDSTEADGHADSLVHIGGIAIDTAWAGETHIHF